MNKILKYTSNNIHERSDKGCSSSQEPGTNRGRFLLSDRHFSANMMKIMSAIANNIQ